LKEEVLNFLGISSTLNISSIYSRQLTNLEQKRRKQLSGKEPVVKTEPKAKDSMKPDRPRREFKVPDKRAVLDLQANEFVVAVLQKYNEERKEAVFRKSNQTCNVCFTSKTGQDCIRFDKCGHIFCKACIGGYFEVQVRDGNVQSLKCLEDKCDVDALPSQV
jgi:E3 ubiquitin-protein ligase RNF14